MWTAYPPASVVTGPARIPISTSLQGFAKGLAFYHDCVESIRTSSRLVRLPAAPENHVPLVDLRGFRILAGDESAASHDDEDLVFSRLVPAEQPVRLQLNTHHAHLMTRAQQRADHGASALVLMYGCTVKVAGFN